MSNPNPNSNNKPSNLPGEVVHLNARPNAEDHSEIKRNISGGDSGTNQMPGSTGVRLQVEDETTEGRHTKQDADHKG